MFEYDELAKEFVKAVEGIQPELDRPAGAFTTQELADVLNVDRSVIRRKIKPLLKAGMVEPIQFKIMTMTGKTFTTIGYRLIDSSQQS